MAQDVQWFHAKQVGPDAWFVFDADGMAMDGPYVSEQDASGAAQQTAEPLQSWLQ